MLSLWCTAQHLVLRWDTVQATVNFLRTQLGFVMLVNKIQDSPISGLLWTELVLSFLLSLGLSFLSFLFHMAPEMHSDTQRPLGCQPGRTEKLPAWTVALPFPRPDVLGSMWGSWGWGHVWLCEWVTWAWERGKKEKLRHLKGTGDLWVVWKGSWRVVGCNWWHQRTHWGLWKKIGGQWSMRKGKVKKKKALHLVIEH